MTEHRSRRSAAASAVEQASALGTPVRAWWVALGGPNAITRWSWILPSIAALVVAASYDTAAFDIPLWPRLVLVAATQVVYAPCVAAAHVVLARLNRPRPLLGLGLMVALGAARGLIIMVLAPWIQPLAIDSAGYHIAINIAFALVTLPVIAVIVDALRRHRALHARFVGEQELWDEALRLAEEQFNADAAAYRAVVDRDITAAVGILLDDLDRVTQEAGAASAAADQLRRLSAEVVRPLSHELILHPPEIDVRPAGMPTVPRRLTLMDVLAEARLAPFAGFGFLCVVLSLLAMVGLSVQGSALLVCLNLVWDLAILGAVPWALGRLLGSRLPQWRPGMAWCFDVGAWIGIGVAGVLGTAVLTWAITGQPRVFWTFALAYALMSAGLSLAFGAFRRQQELDVELLRTLEREQARSAHLLRRVEQERRRMGLILHGSVQSSLTRAIKGLELWDPRQEPENVDSVVSDVRSALKSALAVFDGADRDDPQTQSLRSAVMARLRMWEGVVTMRLVMSPTVENVTDPVITQDVGDVVGEALVNAVRHGQAQNVEIAIDCGENSLTVRVVDDGTGIDGEASAGAGFAGMLQAGYSWTLDREDDRTSLVVCMPLLPSGSRHG